METEISAFGVNIVSKVSLLATSLDIPVVCRYYESAVGSAAH